MKKFLGIVVLSLFLIMPSHSDDIRDFQIEGISIGDSLLDHFNEEIIKNSIPEGMFTNIEDKTFTLSEIVSDTFNDYERIQFIFKRSDKNYELYGMHGVIWIRNNMKACMKKLGEISSAINSSIDYKDNYDFENIEMSGNRGIYSGIVYKLNDGFISIHCYDWTEKIETERGWVDNLRVNIKTKAYEEFLQKD